MRAIVARFCSQWTTDRVAGRGQGILAAEKLAIVIRLRHHGVQFEDELPDVSVGRKLAEAHSEFDVTVKQSLNPETRPRRRLGRARNDHRMYRIR